MWKETIGGKRKEETADMGMAVEIIGIVLTFAGFVIMLLATSKVLGIEMLWGGFGGLLVGVTAVTIGFYKSITYGRMRKKIASRFA